MTDDVDEIRVLHVDDEPDFSSLVATVLERQGDSFTVESATSADEALERLCEASFDCVVSDYEMPGTNGIELLQTVRESHGDLPFILYTGKGSEEVASDAISAGVTDYLQKATGTSQYEVLANRIRNAVQQRRASETQRRLQRLAEHTNDVLWMVTPDWEEVLFVTSRYESVWGQPVDALRDDPWSLVESVHPADREHVETAMEALAAGESVSIECRVDPDAPTARWVWVEGEPMVDDDGEVEAIAGFVRDVTEQKEREHDLQRERDRFTQLYNNFPEPTLTYRYEDGEPIIQDVNEAFVEGFGFDPDVAVGSYVDDLLVPPDRLEEARTIDQRVREGEAVDAVLRRRTADGNGAFQFRNIPLREDSELDGFAVYMDVTEQRDRQRELERYETAVEATGDPIYMLDDVGRFTYVNDALLSLAGYDARDALLGEHVSIVMTDEDVAHGDDLIRGLLTGSDTTATFEMDVITRDGDRVPCENHLALLPFEDDFRGTVGVLRDITDRIQRERQLEAERDRLDEFAHVLTHDIRSPLNVATGHLELARANRESDHLETARDALDRIDELIEDLLEATRTGESGDREPVALETIATRCWRHVDTCSATLHVVDDTTLLADRGRLQQLLENVFRNAVEHAGPDVTITVGTLEDGFFVADDGPGIDAPNPDTVFEDGYTTAEAGTGVGLATVERIVDAHDWTIDVTESDAGGARFEVRAVDTP